MRMKGSFAVLVLVVFLSSGCAWRMGDLTLASTKDISVSDIARSKSTSKGIFEGKDSRHVIVLVPTGLPDLEDALDRALEQGGGTYMKNAVIYWEEWWIPFIYGKISWIIRGEIYALES